MASVNHGTQGNGQGRDTASFRVRLGPAGIHLFDRLTGLNVLLEEVQVPPSAWSAAPRHVSIALTNACDLSCPHCYAPKQPATLDIDVLALWLRELNANGCLGVGFGGGEPTLYRRLPELCKYVSNETDMAVTFTTHGHRLDQELLCALAGNVHFVRISMDGVGTTYEALRGRRFADLQGRMRAARGLAPLGVNFVVNERTLPDLDAALSMAAEVGVTEFLLLPQRPVIGVGGITSRTAEALRRWVTRYRGPVPLTISESGGNGMPTCDPLAAETGLRGFAHIDANGALKRSSFDRDGVPIGNGGVMRALNVLRGA